MENISDRLRQVGFSKDKSQDRDLKTLGKIVENIKATDITCKDIELVRARNSELVDGLITQSGKDQYYYFGMIDRILRYTGQPSLMDWLRTSEYKKLRKLNTPLAEFFEERFGQAVENILGEKIESMEDADELEILRLMQIEAFDRLGENTVEPSETVLGYILERLELGDTKVNWQKFIEYRITKSNSITPAVVNFIAQASPVGVGDALANKITDTFLPYFAQQALEEGKFNSRSNFVLYVVPKTTASLALLNKAPVIRDMIEGGYSFAATNLFDESDFNTEMSEKQKNRFVKTLKKSRKFEQMLNDKTVLASAIKKFCALSRS